MGNVWLLVSMIVVMGLMISIIALFLARSYIKPPPGAALVVTGMGGMKATTSSGIICYPIIHRYQFLSLEGQVIKFAGGELVVRVRQDREAVLDAAVTFGGKDQQQTREVLQALAESAEGDRAALEAKLQKVGYEIL